MAVDEIDLRIAEPQAVKSQEQVLMEFDSPYAAAVFIATRLGLSLECFEVKTMESTASEFNVALKKDGMTFFDLVDVKRDVCRLSNAGQYIVEAAEELDITALTNTNARNKVKDPPLYNGPRNMGEQLLAPNEVSKIDASTISGMIKNVRLSGDVHKFQAVLTDGRGLDIPLTQFAEYQLDMYQGDHLGPMRQPVVAKYMVDSQGDPVVTEILFRES